MLSGALLPLLNFLIDYIAGHLLDQALERSTRLVGQTWQKLKHNQQQPGFITRTQLINRERELRTLKAAIAATPQLQVIYLYGPGGVGKTRLLEEAGQWARRTRIGSQYCWGGILDLYHADLHSIAALQTALIDNLDPARRYFQAYRQARVRFEERRQAGLVGLTLDAEREALSDLFLTEYNAFASQQRPVLAFDTLENLAHESDLIQQLCQLESMPDILQSWLLHQAPQLKNTTLILAGRPQPALQRALDQTYRHQPSQFEAIEISGLTREDFRQLMTALLKQAPAHVQTLTDQTDRLWQLTAGRPVQLALVIELAAHSVSFITTTLPQRNQDENLWGQQLVKALFNDAEPDSRLFFFLALARRGLDLDLLRYLEPGWSPEVCAQCLAKARKLNIVKVRPGRDELFLHDVLYELFDTYPLPEGELRPWRERLADYYRARQAAAWSERMIWAQATVNLLHYELQLNPRQAFEVGYIQWNEIALKGYEVGLDTQLRDELLRFWHSPSNQQLAADTGLTRDQIDLDGAVRWVKRFLMRQRRQQAIDVAETLLAFGPPHLAALASDATTRLANLPTTQRTEATAFFAQAGPFFWGHLLTYYAEALTYAGAPKLRVQQIFEQAIQLLETESLPLASDWLRQRVLGRAHNTFGYLMRIHGHYGHALHAYKRALNCFSSRDSVDEHADTLNNLAFVLALLGDVDYAQEAIDKAMDQRRRLGQRYSLALSHNTRGLIYTLQNQLEMGRRECEWALPDFEELDEPRGIGLACVALGTIYRLQGSFATERREPGTAVTEFYQRGEDFLRRSIVIFSDKVKEPLRLWEAHNELSSLLREWGNTLRIQGQEKVTQEKFSKAIDAHQGALEIARQYGLQFQEADTCDDLAHVWTVRGNLEMAQQWLNCVLALVPEEYLLKPLAGFEHAPASGDAYWLVLGKAQWRQVLWSLYTIEQEHLSQRRRLEVVRAMFHQLVFMYAYLERYWAGAPALHIRLQKIARHLVPLGLLTPQSRRLVDKIAVQYGIEAKKLWEHINHPQTTNESLTRS